MPFKSNLKGEWSKYVTSEPPNAAIGLEVAVVEVHGGGKGVAWVHHRGESTGEERNAFSGRHSFGAVDSSTGGGLESFLGHGPIDHRQVHARLLEDLPATQNTRYSSSS